MKRQNNRYTVLPKKITGFTLIELLVASALSIIVLIAAGSGFVTTQKLSQVAKGRLQVQNDLRNATNMIVRDARMAGSFGCFNLAKMAANNQAKLKDHGTGNVLLGALEFNNQNQGVKYLNGSSLSFTDFTINTSSPKVLLFTYGIGSSSGYTSNGTNGFSVQVEKNGELAELEGKDKAPIIISTCSSLERYQSGKKEVEGDVKLKVSDLSPSLGAEHNTTTNPRLKSEVSVFRQVVNIYAIGTPKGGEEGLYLFQLNPDGTLGKPQLLLAGVKSWKVKFGYVQAPGCRSMQNDAKIKFTDEIESNKSALSPVLLRMQLQGSGSNGDLKSGKAANNSESDVQTYYINATIRGGNSCAERNFQEDAI